MTQTKLSHRHINEFITLLIQLAWSNICLYCYVNNSSNRYYTFINKNILQNQWVYKPLLHIYWSIIQSGKNRQIQQIMSRRSIKIALIDAIVNTLTIGHQKKILLPLTLLKNTLCIAKYLVINWIKYLN